jgi:hypothetical protein
MVGVVELALWISSDRHTELKLVCQWIDKIKDKIVLGFTTLHDTRDATQFRNAGPLTPRHKGTVYWR